MIIFVTYVQINIKGDYYMGKNIGKTTWVFADMYWPQDDNGNEYVSHEAICVLNLSQKDADVNLDFYYEDREPILGIKCNCAAKRSTHIRIDAVKVESGKPLPRGVGYAAVLTSDVPIVAQYTRVDTTQAELALMTSSGFNY